MKAAFSSFACKLQYVCVRKSLQHSAHSDKDNSYFTITLYREKKHYSIHVMLYFLPQKAVLRNILRQS